MNRLIGFQKLRSGQSMLEAVVVVAIVVLLVTGLVSAATASLRMSQMSKSRAQALQYAKEGLEVVRIIKDKDWNSIPLTTKSYCLSKGQQELVTELVVCPMNIDSIYSRTITISDSGTCTAVNSCRNVQVTVSWKEANQDKSVSLTSYVTNWRTQQ